MNCQTCGTETEKLLKGDCRPCYHKKYYQSHREEIISNVRKYRQSDKGKASQRKYYLTVTKPKLEAEKHDH